MTLDDGNWGIIGHEWAVDLLRRRLASGRLGHAYLFTGAPGTGRATLALRLAQALNCEAGPPGSPGTPCGECRPCRQIGRGQHPDLHVVAPENRSIKIEAVRGLQHDLTMAPYEAAYRVAILQDMQAASDQAADALLKTIEEPLPTTRLLLTADSAETLPATIASRCQVLMLRPVPAETLARALAACYDVSPEKAALLARLSGGRPGWAIARAEDPALLEGREAIFEALLGMLHADRTERFAYSESIARDDSLPEVLDLWQSWWRDVLLLAEGSSVPPVNADRAGDLEHIATAVAPEQARTALRAVRRTIATLEVYANTRLALDVMLLDIPRI